MEVKKGQNMLEHEAEIYSRPARTWFQSGRDKQQSECASQPSSPTFIFLAYKLPNLALSKRQYENNFQKDNSMDQKSYGSKAQAEKVLFPYRMKRTCRLALTPGPRSQRVTSSPALVGE